MHLLLPQVRSGWTMKYIICQKYMSSAKLLFLYCLLGLNVDAVLSVRIFSYKVRSKVTEAPFKFKGKELAHMWVSCYPLSLHIPNSILSPSLPCRTTRLRLPTVSCLSLKPYLWPQGIPSEQTIRRQGDAGLIQGAICLGWLCKSQGNLPVHRTLGTTSGWSLDMKKEIAWVFLKYTDSWAMANQVGQLIRDLAIFKHIGRLGPRSSVGKLRHGSLRMATVFKAIWAPCKCPPEDIHFMEG